MKRVCFRIVVSVFLLVLLLILSCSWCWRPQELTDRLIPLIPQKSQQESKPCSLIARSDKSFDSLWINFSVVDNSDPIVITFKTQLRNWWKCGCPESIIDIFMEQRDSIFSRVRTIDIGEGDIPFLLVIPRECWDGSGHGCCPPKDPFSISDTNIYHAPEEPYAIFDIDVKQKFNDIFGQKRMNVDKINQFLDSLGRRGLTTDEVLSLLKHYDYFHSPNAKYVELGQVNARELSSNQKVWKVSEDEIMKLSAYGVNVSCIHAIGSLSLWEDSSIWVPNFFLWFNSELCCSGSAPWNSFGWYVVSCQK